MENTAFSEARIPAQIGVERGPGPLERGFAASLLAEGRHYALDVNGTEELYDVAADPEERRNVKNDPAQKEALGRLRTGLVPLLGENRDRFSAAASYQQQSEVCWVR
jgi:hypothetical protein